MTDEKKAGATDNSIFAEIKAKCPEPLPQNKACECEVNLNIGLFFDGADNNKNPQKDKDKSMLFKPNANTNVARLWEAYKSDREAGYYSNYVSGVGTPFTELEMDEAELGGGPLGTGGDTRIIYGLLVTINSVFNFVNKENRFDVKNLRALCSSQNVPSYGEERWNLSAEQKALKDLDLGSGLKDASDKVRSRFFGEVSRDLSLQLKQSKLKISGIYLDVFGFSRGATQARVFVNWLHKYLLINGKLFGVPAYVRMLGLFDTVATVGLSDAVGSNGHNYWATADNLKIHKEVKNCYHIIALHELRTNFPLDSVAVGDTMPANCQEVYTPGVHSDVGGAMSLVSKERLYVHSPQYWVMR